MHLLQVLGFDAHLPGQSWGSRRWGHLDDIGPAGGVG